MTGVMRPERYFALNCVLRLLTAESCTTWMGIRRVRKFKLGLWVKLKVNNDLELFVCREKWRNNQSIRLNISYYIAAGKLCNVTHHWVVLS